MLFPATFCLVNSDTYRVLLYPKHKQKWIAILEGPKIEDLPRKLSTVTIDAMNETSVEVRIRVPKIVDGRSGFYKVFYTAGLQ